MRLKVTLMVALVIFGFLGLIKAVGGSDNCTEFGFQISTSCCCTANCCREAGPGEVVHVEDDIYRIVPSGQLIKRTGWSPDGRTVRCACDSIQGKWTVHPTAFTRCLYTPFPNS